MKYCAKCGAQLVDEAVFCTSCGCEVPNLAEEKEKNKKSGMQTAIKVLLIVGMVVSACLTYGISLLWSIPMTIYYWTKVDKGEKVGLGFKICTIIFTSTIAGILMLFENEG